MSKLIDSSYFVGRTFNEIKLYPEQVPHIVKLINTAMYEKHAMDCSLPGSGKTIIALVIACVLEMNVVVIGPHLTEFSWRDSYEKLRGCGIGSFDFISTSSLIHNNKYISEDRSGNVTTYTARQTLLDISAPGTKTLVVIDEGHDFKNKVRRYGVLDAFMSYFTYDGSLCRTLILSATPYSSMESVRNYLSMLKIIDPITPDNFRNSLNNLVGWCEKYDKARTDEIVNGYGKINFNNIHNLLEMLASEVFVPAISSSVEEAYPNRTFNMYIDIHNYEGDRDLYNRTVETWGVGDSTTRSKGNTVTEYSASLSKLERAVVPSLAYYIFTKIMSCRDKNLKVILAVNRKESIATIRNTFASTPYIKLSVIDGDVNKNIRENIVKDFQSIDRKELLVMTGSAGGTGINLNTFSENNPVLTFIVPTSYDVTMENQISGRAHRRNMITYPQCFIVWSKNTEQPVHLQNTKKNAFRILARSRNQHPQDSTGMIRDCKCFVPGYFPDFVEGIGYLDPRVSYSDNPAEMLELLASNPNAIPTVDAPSFDLDTSWVI